MKKIFLCIALSALSCICIAQLQTAQWRFGINAALDFTSGSPVVINGSTHNIPEGCSSVSTSAGTLLFYTNGVDVWDATNSVMPNGTGLMGDLSSTQSALIVPSPSNSNQYYIFTTPADGGINGFRYSIVDMILNSGLGDVSTLNTFVSDSVTEKVSAVKDAANSGYWISVHCWGSNKFKAYHLTTTGISAPVASSTGIVYTTSAIQNTYGQMKFSTCGSKLALAAGYLNNVEVFDFDVNTGIVSNPITIPMPDHVYGVEFSKNSNLLYVSCYDATGTLVQFDVSLSTAAAIIASRTALSITSDIYGLQMALDGKIYVVKSFNQFLGVINSPNTVGWMCNYVDNGIDLDPAFNGNTAALSLPCFMQSYLNTDVSCTTSGVEEYQTSEGDLVYPNPSDDGIFYLSNQNENTTTINVYNQLGVNEGSWESGANKQKMFIDLSSFSKGIYFYVISSNNGKVKRGKLINN